MSDEATHPSFVSQIHTRLVTPRRNTARALRAYREGDLVMLKVYLDELDQQINALYQLAVTEEGRHTKTCNLGHVHYVEGDA